MIYRTINYRGNHSLYASRTESGLIPGLGGFSLEFTNSDHRINSIIAGGATRGGDTIDFDSFVLGFSDNDHDSVLGSSDPTHMWAKYFSIEPGPTFVASGSGSGNETVTVSTVRTDPDHLFLLRGFMIRAARGSNHNLRRIGIRHHHAHNNLSISFHDDSATDDVFTFEVLYTIVELANTSGRRADFYFTGPYSENFQFIQSALINKSPRGFSLLSGFEFRFNDHDHHIRKIAIDPVSEEQFSVTFTDDERDNMVTGWLEYVLVHEFGDS